MNFKKVFLNNWKLIIGFFSWVFLIYYLINILEYNSTKEYYEHKNFEKCAPEIELEKQVSVNSKDAIKIYCNGWSNCEASSFRWSDKHKTKIYFKLPSFIKYLNDTTYLEINTKMINDGIQKVEIQINDKKISTIELNKNISKIKIPPHTFKENNKIFFNLPNAHSVGNDTRILGIALTSFCIKLKEENIQLENENIVLKPFKTYSVCDLRFQNIFQSGLSGCEDSTFRWSKEKNVVLKFLYDTSNIENSENYIRLNCKMIMDRSQILGINLNGHNLGEYTIVKSKNPYIEILLPSKKLAFSNIITMNLPNSHSIETDSRTLGIALKSINIIKK